MKKSKYYAWPIIINNLYRQWERGTFTGHYNNNGWPIFNLKENQQIAIPLNQCILISKKKRKNH